MKEIKISQKVYTKNFNVKSLGYCCEEVDEFLDELNLEIVKLERKIEGLLEKNRQLDASRMALEQKNKELSIEVYNLKAHNPIPSSTNANFSNIDLLNRIANLENMVQKLLDQNKDK